MKHKNLVISFVFALGLTFSLSWAQTTRYVNPDGTCGGNTPCYTTIQAAINAASSGDIIEVAAGNYNERLNISKSLTLKGAQYGVDPTPAGVRTNPSAESVVDLTGLPVANPNVLVEIPSGVTNVILDGFTLIGSPTIYYADESVIRCWDDNITISNNIVNGYYSILLKGSDNLTVDQNRIVANKAGITIQPNTATNAALTNNIIAIGTSPASDNSGIYLTATSNTTISGNTVNGFATGRGIGGSNLTNITLSSNKLSGNRDGISFFGNTTFITIQDNDLSNSTRYGINIKGQDIDITKNQITNNGDVGIYIDKHTLTTERVTVNCNNISNNTNYGLYVNTANVTITVDAEKNWWGHASGPAGVGPGTGDKVTANVDYDPWLADNDIANCDNLIPVELKSFGAQFNNNVVTLAWSTATETENLGFHVYRSSVADGEFVQINKEMILGAGSSAEAHTYSYIDREVESGNAYYYKLADVDFNGNIAYHGPISITVGATTPTKYELAQSYPNPFNPETAINFSLKEAGKVSLNIYNLQGQLIRSLVDEDKLAGSYSVIWNGTNDQGIRVSNGTYLYTLKVNGFEETKKLVFMK